MQPSVVYDHTQPGSVGIHSGKVHSTDPAVPYADHPSRSVHITNYYHQSSGGVKANYDKLLRAADRHRRYISLIVPGEKSEIKTVGDFGKIYFVKANPAPFFDKRYRVMMPNQYLFKGSAVRNILLKERPDFI